MAGNVLEVTEQGFQDEVLGDANPVLVDFWAPWCGPCLRMAPVVEELAKDYDGRLKVAKINVDDAPGIATNLGIQGIPTFMMFKGGKMVERFTGAVMKETLKDAIDKHV